MKETLRGWGLALGIAGLYAVGPVSMALVDHHVAQDIQFVEYDNLLNPFQEKGVVVKRYDNRTEVVLRTEPILNSRLVDTNNDGQADVYRAVQLGPMRLPVGYERRATLDEQALFDNVMNKYNRSL